MTAPPQCSIDLTLESAITQRRDAAVQHIAEAEAKAAKRRATTR
jgi:hypothetical protein